ncbi:DUF6188 family protein [Kitasatospora sp. NPDC007106]|uniref:DUF6188 family protein n=1 Tax=Kitasatospora sp. NPDC007106 TaxID=3156914 RepID=UPI0033DA8137
MIDELGDRWIIGLRGTPVVAATQTSDGQELTVTLAGGVVLETFGPTLLTDGPATAPDAVALPGEEVVRLIGATVLSAVAFKSGSLRMVFSTGHHLNVRSAESEATARIRNDGVFEWSCREGIGTMRAFRPEDL